MTRQTRFFRDAEHMLALFVGLFAAWAVIAFVHEAALYILMAATVALGVLLLRRKATHTDFTVRFGIFVFIAGLAAALIRPHLNLG